jgi:AbrB family looped-hinge helix DNA binding protein
MNAATITSKGQITIPSEVRRMWHLKTGDSVEFYADHKGELLIRPLNANPLAFLEAVPARARLPEFASDDDAISAAAIARNVPYGRKRAVE